MSKLTLKQLKQLYDHVTYYNKMAPFPIYDTEYVQKLKETMDEIEQSKENYDELPVDACSGCKSLFITMDDEKNAICMKCSSMNQINTYANIHEYLKVKNIWND